MYNKAIELLWICIQHIKITMKIYIHTIYILWESIEFMFRKKQLIVFFNNRDTSSFIENYCGQSTAIQNEANWDAVGKQTASLKTLNNEYLNISWSFSFPFDFVFDYKILARTGNGYKPNANTCSFENLQHKE